MRTDVAGECRLSGVPHQVRREEVVMPLRWVSAQNPATSRQRGHCSRISSWLVKEKGIRHAGGTPTLQEPGRGVRRGAEALGLPKESLDLSQEREHRVLKEYAVDFAVGKGEGRKRRRLCRREKKGSNRNWTRGGERRAKKTRIMKRERGKQRPPY